MMGRNFLSSVVSSGRDDLVDVEMFSTSWAASVDGGGREVNDPAERLAWLACAASPLGFEAMLSSASRSGLTAFVWRPTKELENLQVTFLDTNTTAGHNAISRDEVSTTYTNAPPFLLVSQRTILLLVRFALRK
jgi:hypothetical protein